MLVIGFLPNATQNLAYDFWELRLKLATTEANYLDEEFAKAEQAKARLLGWGYANFFYLRNPFGKILQLIGDPLYKDYIFKQHDTDGYVRLVALQLKLIAEHVSPTNIPQALEKSGPEFRNPYTLNPMEWDAAASQLRFEGRQPDSENQGKKKTYTVTIPRGKT